MGRRSGGLRKMLPRKPRSVNDSLSKTTLFKEIVNSALSKPFPSASLESKSSTKAPPY